MKRIVELDLDNERAVVEPGVVNLDINASRPSDKYFYAPTPPASEPAPSEATSRKTPAARTPSPTESPPTTF